MNKNNYDLIASFYVLLRKIVFGIKTEQAYNYYLNHVKAWDKVLIVGGGAGKILLNPNLSSEGVEIDYVDSSPKMLELAEKLNVNAKINFICQNVLFYTPHSKYDVIVLPFVLDVFNELNLIKTINLVKSWLEEGGLIIVSDFVPPEKFSQKAILWLMFVFFRITTNIEAHELLDIDNYLGQSRLKKNAHISFSKGFIFSALYEKIQDKQGF